MGQETSKERAYSKLQRTIPGTEDFRYVENGKSKSEKLFGNDQDRDQFINAILILISDNGHINLDAASFKLLYTRRENGRMVATVCAMNDMAVVAKIDPDCDGANQVEAFKALRQFVEVRLYQVLKAVPGGSGPVSAVASLPLRADQPPAYDRKS